MVLTEASGAGTSFLSPPRHLVPPQGGQQVLSKYLLSSESVIYILDLLDLCKTKIVSQNQVPGLQGSQRPSAGHVALHPL